MDHKQSRRQHLAAISAAVLASFTNGAQAQPSVYPNRPVRIIIGFVAGGVSDNMMRMLAPELSIALGQPIIVENRPGAAGITAAGYVAKSPPDGYTLYMAPNTHLINQALQPKLPFDVIKDFSSITLLTSTVTVLAVSTQSPIMDLQAFIKAAKEDPGAISYATSGIGTTVHLAGEMLANQAGINLNHIPYNGANQSVEAVLAGHVTSSVSAIASARPFIDSGKLRVLGVMGERRSTFLPNAPTFAELGFPKMQSDTWLGIIGPAKMSQEISSRLNAELLKILAKPDVKEKILTLGSEPVGVGLRAFERRQETELASIIKIVREANIKPE